MSLHFRRPRSLPAARYGALIVLVVAGVSCDSKPVAAKLPTVPLNGKVYLNQKPLANALIVFHPISKPDGVSYRGYAHTGSDGSFSLSTFVLNDGVPAGSYRVTIQMQDEGDGPVRIPARYRSPETSGITVQVRGDKPTLDPFHLRSP